jgi:hypothetical protein
MQLLESTDGVLIATPEKLDLLLRAHPTWFATVRLVIVDEAHLLQEGERGLRLELLLSNLRREQAQARLLLMTPFMENAVELSTWLGGNRGLPINVNWRPSRVLLGLASVSGAGKKRALRLKWKDPYEPERTPSETVIPTNVPYAEISTKLGKATHLEKVFRKLGCVMTVFSGSRSDAEKGASLAASQRKKVGGEQLGPALRVAIALSRHDYGKESVLADCLERRVAFHHSSLSSTLRYLIEDQVRAKNINYISATSTLAQGMNFPVATVLVHSVHKPYGNGPFTPSEFWNIAGRAGRVGMVDRGMVVFVDKGQREQWEKYSSSLSESMQSAFLEVLSQIPSDQSIKELYRELPVARPFLQYLAHAAAVSSVPEATRNLEELLQASLFNRQTDTAGAQRLRKLARRYLAEIAGKKKGYLSVADKTGLGSFSFDELYAKTGDDPILRAGPGEIMRSGQKGVGHLIDALRWLPELNLAIGKGSGAMDVDAVARVVQGWIDGHPIHELAKEFPGKDESRIRNAGTYAYSTVSQIISWGAHAYTRGWMLRTKNESPAPQEQMLPAYIQHGVDTPEAALASLLGVPRNIASGFSNYYRQKVAPIKPADGPKYRAFIEGADVATWTGAIDASSLKGQIDPADIRHVWRKMQGVQD